MERKVIIVCEGKSDLSYLHALQRFVENDIALPAGRNDPLLRFVPYPEPCGTCTGGYDKITAAYRSAVEDFSPDPVEIWVDADIYIRDEPLGPDSDRSNGEEYGNKSPDIPVFSFSFHNFEDFIVLHADDAVFLKWKELVLAARGAQSQRKHCDWPLPRAEYAPLFQKVLPHYSKRRTPFPLSVERLTNLRRHLNDPDVRSMASLLQTGIVFGEHLLQLFDAAYPGLIP